MLEWYRRNQTRLSYLKEIYLQDLTLYYDGGGQEKRNFIGRLVIIMVKDKANMEIAFNKIDDHIKNLRKLIKKSLLLGDL